MTFRMMLGQDMRARILSRAKKEGWYPDGKGMWSNGKESWPLEDVLLHYS